MGRPTVGFVEDSDEDFALFSRVFGKGWDLERCSALAAGADAFFTKPGSVAGLRELAAQVSELAAAR